MAKQRNQIGDNMNNTCLEDMLNFLSKFNIVTVEDYLNTIDSIYLNIKFENLNVNKIYTLHQGYNVADLIKFLRSIILPDVFYISTSYDVGTIWFKDERRAVYNGRRWRFTSKG